MRREATTCKAPVFSIAKKVRKMGKKVEEKDWLNYDILIPEVRYGVVWCRYVSPVLWVRAPCAS